MIGIVILILFFFGINGILISFYQRRHPWLSRKKMNLLYIYHLFFYAIYTVYAYNNPSDSHRYFRDVSSHEGSWFELFGTDTTFINFLAYPFYSLGFTYDMLMLTFSWFGYLGFFYAYLFFREKIPVKIKVFKSTDLLTLILFFPNMHFWSASMGKGAPIFLGLMMFAYAIINPKSRVFLLLIASFVVFYIRPHVFMFVAVGTVAGYFSGKEKISFGRKLLISAALIGTLIVVQDEILAVVNLGQSENLVGDFEKFSETRSEDLSTAGSGVDMNAYPLPLKLFTFWFRPLFFDAPNILGVIISFENLIYLLLFFKIMKKDFIKFVRKAPSLVKMSLVIFFTTSLAMTFIMSNLGIIMRQKSMVMYFLFFVIYYYLAQKRYNRIIRLRKLRRKISIQEKEKTPTALA